MKKYKYQIFRRLMQAAVLFLFFAGNAYGWTVLRGNLSSARILGMVPLSDPFAVLQSLSAGAGLSADALVGAGIVVLLYGILGGRLFCGWVCPVNIVTDFANKLREIFRFNEVFHSLNTGRNVRYWIMVMALPLSFFLGTAAYEWINPIGVLNRGIVFGMGLGWSYVLIVFLYDLFAVRNGFCGHICPVGGMYALLGRFGFLRVDYDREKCTMCMKCIEICPEKQVLHMVGKLSAPVVSGECINCGRCIEVCDDDAVRFYSIYSKKSANNKKEGAS